MDAKGLAKSKRAHSLAHSKKPHSKSSSSSSGSHKAGSSRERDRLSGLPSNWDRYEEENVENLDDNNGGDVMGQSTDDVVLPKSKGADFRYLVAEAKSQSLRNCCPDDGFLSLDDGFHGDFYQKMLSVRGESILSWIGDDNFVVDNEAASSHEVSLFSLNLLALSEQLAKVDISERLFIEAELLDPEDTKASSSKDSDLGEINEANTEILGTSSFQDFDEKNKVMERASNMVSPGSTTVCSTKEILTEQGLDIIGQQHGFPSSSGQDGRFSRSTDLECAAQNKMSFNVNPESSSSTFNVDTLEAELDMLLNSSSESKMRTLSLLGHEEDKVKRLSEVVLSCSGGAGSSIAYSADKEIPVQVRVELDASQGSKSIQSETPDFPPKVGMSHDTKPRKYSPTFETAAAEAQLDMLLNSFPETKFPASSNQQFNSLMDPPKGTPTSIAPKERFSLSREFTANLDDVLDCLVEETSKRMNQNGVQENEKKNAAGPCELQSSKIQSSSNSKVLDNFDSWMDTI